MNRIMPATSLLISGYFIVMIVKHMIAPGGNTGYTRMLMFACLGTIPLSFMMMIAGATGKWSALFTVAREAAGGSTLLYVLAIIGLVAVAVVLPVVLLAAAWYAMGLRLGFMFVLFFAPVAMRLALSPAKECAVNGVIQALLFFAAMLIGAGIYALLEKHSLEGAYAKQVQAVWEGYDYASSGRMFFAITVFALANQLIELGFSIAGLVRGR
jgi:hypothetical protein